jgi:oxalate decarboxylase/phosphoglucose isomerase-like protein (cupin superfamily)
MATRKPTKTPARTLLQSIFSKEPMTFSFHYPNQVTINYQTLVWLEETPISIVIVNNYHQKYYLTKERRRNLNPSPLKWG